MGRVFFLFGQRLTFDFFLEDFFCKSFATTYIVVYINVFVFLKMYSICTYMSMMTGG